MHDTSLQGPTASVSDNDDDDDVPELIGATEVVPRARAGVSTSGAFEFPACPVTLVTGFLGAGKTTLVNHVLHETHARQRVAVVVNEFSEGLGIEHAVARDALVDEAGAGADEDESEGLVRSGRERGEWIELPNGCVCCTVKGELVSALEVLVGRGRREGRPFAAVLLETTGLANPGPVAEAFWLDDELRSDLVLDSIVCVVDAANMHRHLWEARAGDASNEMQLQIAYADTVLLNKADLVSGEELAQCEGDVRRFNAEARVLRTVRSSANVSLLLGQRRFDADAAAARHDAEAAARASTCSAPDCQDPEHVHHGHGHVHSNDGHPPGPKLRDASHDAAGVSSCVATCVGDMDLSRLDTWLSGLLWHEGKGADLYRSKGVVAVAGCQRKYAYQGVHEAYEVRESTLAWEPGEPRATRMVFIGRNLDRDQLQEGLASCLATV